MDDKQPLGENNFFNHFNRLCSGAQRPVELEGEKNPNIRKSWTRPADSNINCFEYHREMAGFTHQEIADQLNVSLGYYLDIEEDKVEPPLPFIDKFCGITGTTRLDLYNPFDPNIRATLIDGLMRSYQNPSALEQLIPDYQSEIEDILIQEGAVEESYSKLHEQMSHYFFTTGKDNYEVAKFIEKLLINDGNPMLGGNGVLLLIEERQARLERILKNAELNYAVAAKKQMVIQEQFNESAFHAFGHSWKSHARIFNSLMMSSKMQWPLGDVIDFFMNDVPGRKPKATDNDILKIFELSESYTEAHQATIHRANSCKLAQSRLSIFEEFVEKNQGALKSYDNRQLILQCVPHLLPRTMADVNHSEYIKSAVTDADVESVINNSWKKPIALLPPPKPKSP